MARPEIPYVTPVQTDPAAFPRSDEAPAGMKTVKFEDSFGYAVDFKPNVVYCQRGDVSLHLQILTPRPQKPGQTFPLIVYVQGSAWREQNLFASLAKLIRTAEKGYVCAIVEYRHTGIAPFPAQVLDAKEAIRFLKKNAADYLIAPDRVALWGDSSGGHTAVLAGITGDRVLTEPSDISAEVCCIVDWYGPVSIAAMNCVPSAIDHVQPDSPEGMLIGGLNVTENLDLAAKTDPRTYLDPAAAIPPLLIMHGNRDMLVAFNQSCLLYEACKEAGKDVTFYCLEDANHGFLGFQSEGALAIVEDFIGEHLS